MITSIIKKSVIWIVSILYILYLYKWLELSDEEAMPLLVIGVAFLISIFAQNRNTFKTDTKLKILNIIFALYISFSFYIGKIAWKSNDLHFLSLTNMLIVIGGVPAFALIIESIEYWWINFKFINPKESNNKEHKILDKHSFVIFTIILLLSWLPALISNYPGIIISDYVWQFNQASGECELNNHHPIIHTLLIRFSQAISRYISGGCINNTYAVLINSILQMLILALCIAYVSSALWKVSQKGQKIALFMLLLAALFPLHALFSIYMTKDVIFSALILLLSYMIWKLVWKNNYSILQYIALFIISALTILFRSNGFLIVLGSLFIIFIANKNFKVLGILLSLIIILIMQNMLLSSLNISQTELSESLGMPINQIGNIIVNEEELTANEITLIEKVMPIETIKSVYNKRYSDHIKFDSSYNEIEIQKNKEEYLKLWLKLFFKYPRDCIEASLNLTIGFWYPGVEKGCISFDYGSRTQFYTDLGIYNYSTSELYKHWIDTDVRNSIFEAWLWSPGLAVMFMLFLLIICVAQKSMLLLQVFLPGIMGWFSLLLGTPSYCETRYIYFIFLLIPFYMGILILDKERNSNG